MKATGVLKTRVDGEWQEVPEFHRWTIKLGPTKFPVQLSLHVCPFNEDILRISEVSTGGDTQAIVLSPKNHKPILRRHLRKGHRLYVPGHEVRKLARTAAYCHIQKVGELNFLTAIAHAVVVGKTTVDETLRQELGKKPVGVAQ